MIAIGLDYGTTNSLLTVYQKDMTKSELVKVQIPSVYNNGTECVLSPKRLLNNPTSENKPKVVEYIGSCIGKLFSELKRRNSQLDFSDVKLAVTVPNAFKDVQVKLMKKIVADVFSEQFPSSSVEIEIIPEPISAALYLAYVQAERSIDSNDKYYVVSDMGGGTTDTAIVNISAKSGYLKFNVVCTQQEIQLGGIDIDKALANHLKEKYGLSDVDEECLLRASRYIKEQLSFKRDLATPLLLQDGTMYHRPGQTVEMTMTMTRDEFESVLDSAKVKAGQFGEVYRELLGNLKSDFIRQLESEEYDESKIQSILRNNLMLLPVGGSSRIPRIQQYLKEVFCSERMITLNTENDTMDNVPKFDSVCRGASIYAAYLAGELDKKIVAIEMEGRSLHKISLKYTDHKLFTIVDKSMPDGVYKKFLTPKSFLDKSGKFTIGTLAFYQGGKEEYLDDDCILLHKLEFPEILYTDKTDVKKVSINLYVTMTQGRMSKVKVEVPSVQIHGEKSIYVKEVKLY